MFVRLIWGLGPVHSGFADDELPLAFELEGALANVRRSDGEEDLEIVLDIPVNPAHLHLNTAGETSAEATVDVPDMERGVVIARRIADGIAFLTRTPLSLRGRADSGPELYPESDEDAQVLDTFGTRRVTRVFGARGGAWMRLPLVPQNLIALSERPSGIRLYADALKMGTSTGKLRELWKVLEAAFGQKDDELVDSLSRCSAATDMEFTRDELRELLVLRGRASHAYSRADLAEIVAVEHQADEVLDRIQGLAEALIVRKKDWAVRTVAIEPSSPRYPYVQRDGVPVFFVRDRVEGE